MQHTIENGIYGEGDIWKFYSISEAEAHENSCPNWQHILERFKEIYGKCDNLSKTVGINNLTGIVIDCSYVEGDDKVVETQTFDYNTIDKGELKSAYTEAGVEYPEFELDDNINEIEKSMLAGGFTCQKVS